MELSGNVQGIIELLGGGDSVTISTEFESGTLLATFTLNGTDVYYIYAPEIDYTEVINKPSINGNELIGDKSAADLGLFSGSYGDLTDKPYYNNFPITDNIYSYNYSLDEQIVGKWIDDSYIYAKTWVNNTVIGVNWTNTGIDRGEIDKIINCHVLGEGSRNYNGCVIASADLSEYLNKVCLRNCRSQGGTLTMTHLVLFYTKSS